MTLIRHIDPWTGDVLNIERFKIDRDAVARLREWQAEGRCCEIQYVDDQPAEATHE